MENAAVISYYNRLIMAKNQGHFEIAQALLALIENATDLDQSAADYRKAMDKIAQAKGYAAAIAAGTETTAAATESEVSDWEGYVYNNPPFTRQLALALANYFEKAARFNQAYEMYLSASELDDAFDGFEASAQQAIKMKQAEDGTMANDFGKQCEAQGNHAAAASWYKKAKEAGNAEAVESLGRMQAFHGVARFYTPWLEIAKRTGRKELAEAINAMLSADPKLAGVNQEAVTIGESAVPPCYEEVDFWERELEEFSKFSDVSTDAAIIAIGKLLERAKMYNIALRWYKKAVPAANADAHRMLPLKSKSVPMREAEDIYDSASSIPALWK